MELYYQHLGVHIWVRDREVIRAAWRMIARKDRREPAKREDRKAFYRGLLWRHYSHQALARHFRL